MNEDIDFRPAVSIYDDGIIATSPSHLPCPDMPALESYDPSKTQRAQFLLSKLREKHGIKKRTKPTQRPMTYLCTSQGCIESWGSVSNVNREEGH